MMDAILAQGGLYGNNTGALNALCLAGAFQKIIRFNRVADPLKLL